MGIISKQYGNHGEDIAAEYLIQQGYRIVEKNFHSSQGEIDIIAQDGEFLIFVEVKFYSAKSWGHPLGAVRKSKRDSIIHAAQTYLLKKQIKNIYCRFDVIAITRRENNIEKIEHIKSAFQT